VKEFEATFVKLQSAFQADVTFDIKLAIVRVVEDIKSLEQDVKELSMLYCVHMPPFHVPQLSKRG
jgi:hypothetical protein